MCKMIYKKCEKMDPVQANKKFFRANPNLAEFAKAQPLPKDPEELIFQQPQQQLLPEAQQPVKKKKI